MLVVMYQDAPGEQIDAVLSVLREKKLKPQLLPGETRVAIGIMGNKEYVPEDIISRMPGVKEIIHVTKAYKSVSREFRPESTVVQVGNVPFGTGEVVIIAGPCSVESEEQVMETARHVKLHGAQVLRGGIFKPRTSPYFFQGIGYVGLEYLKRARNETGLPISVEIMSIDDIDVFQSEVDLIQIGARNMQNFDLLKRLSKVRKPVLLKRGASATVEEFLLAAEYLLDGGNDQVILCERGIRTFETSTRNTLDLNSVALIKQLSHLPIIVDPSHGTGRHDLVIPLSRAALAVGADGIIVEVHPNPLKALSDANQQLSFNEFTCLMEELVIFRHHKEFC